MILLSPSVRKCFISKEIPTHNPTFLLPLSFFSANSLGIMVPDPENVIWDNKLVSSTNAWTLGHCHRVTYFQELEQLWVFAVTTLYWIRSLSRLKITGIYRHKHKCLQGSLLSTPHLFFKKYLCSCLCGITSSPYIFVLSYRICKAGFESNHKVVCWILTSLSIPYHWSLIHDMLTV